MVETERTMPEGKAVQSMFAGISSRYDRANHWLSFGMDFLWRRRLVQEVARHNPQRLADLATGSGDVAFALKAGIPQLDVVGLDFCQPMLDEADRKQDRFPEEEKIHFRFGDCLALPLETESQDAVTIAFGLRNLEDRMKGLAEMKRVLKPGGVVCILEFTQPYFWFSPFYYFYLKGILPVLARLLTGNRSAYEYLGGSISSFPGRASLSRQLSSAGFVHPRAIPMTFSIVALHLAEKPD